MKKLKKRILSAVAVAGIGAVPDIGFKSPFVVTASAEGEVNVSTWAELNSAMTARRTALS